MTETSSSLNDDEFYQKLMQLREEQKATMKQLESLYAAKMEAQGTEVEVTGSAENLELLAAQNIQISDARLADLEREYRDLSLADFPTNDNAESQDIDHNQNGYFERVSADRMWDGVAITDYMNRLDLEHERNLDDIEMTLKRHRMNSLSKKTDDWKPSITVPKPFSMTIREYQKPKKKSRSQQIFELEQEQKRLSEMKELTKKFKANPIPGHTFLPLYETMQDKDKNVRSSSKEKRKSDLQSMTKPFKFTDRDNDYARISKLSKSIDKMIADESERPPQFKAKPVPRKVLDKPSVTEKMQEEELFRQMRCKLRAQTLLRQSKAPVSSPEVSKTAIRKNKEEPSDSRNSLPRRSRSALSHSVPDFDAQYKKFLNEAEKIRTMKESTVCKPFTMRTEQKHSAKVEKCVKADLDIRSRPLSGRAALSPAQSGAPIGKHKTYKSDTIPPKITKSFELMASKNREKLSESARESKLNEYEAKKKKAKEQALRKHIAMKAAANDNRLLLEETRARKVQEFREQQRELEMEYQQKLASMSDRLENRQLLFERASEINAKKEADKRYIETLRNAGIDDDLFNSITSAGRGSSYDLKVEDFNDSLVDENLDDSYASDFDSSDKLTPEH
ncbi:protein FAM161B-like [Symsagittifera roscoffensis]|uniref:protein FAM161B-like n=1 Tax=Symsagittifera roscoffensis TaxID=84072 RepID=UPI00307B4103